MERAEQLRPVFVELAGKSARKIAAALNERKIATPTGGVWHAATVIRVQKRLGLRVLAEPSRSACWSVRLL